MKDYQKQLSKILVQDFYNRYDKDMTIFFTSNVAYYCEEISKKSTFPIKSTYEAKTYKGHYIPLEVDPDHIIIQENQSDFYDIKTLFHEYSHACLFRDFLNSMYNNDMHKLVQDYRYKYFTLFDEYEATKNGILQYLSFYTEFCKNELPATGLCKKILDESREFYSDFSCVKNNFQCLCHVLQYYGAIRAINIFLPNFDTDDYFDDMSVENDLKSLFETINNFQMNEEWLEQFVDKAWNIVN